MFKKLEFIKKFVGPEVYRAYFLSFIVGFGWFLTESGFVFILQGFLLSLGILKSDQVSMLPSWYPTTTLATSVILIVYGVVRSIVTYFRNYLSGYIGQSFNRYQRERFLSYGLNNVNIIKTHELISLFNERIQQSSTVLQYLVFFFINAVSLVFFLGFGLKIAPYELMISLVLLALFIYPFKFLNKRIESTGKFLIDEWNNVNRVMVQGFKNYFFLKVYGLIDQEVHKGNKSLEYYENHYKGYFRLASLKLAFPIWVGTMVVSLVTFVSFKNNLSNGVVLISFYYIFIRITQAVADSSSMLSVVKLNLEGFKILIQWNDRIDEFVNSKKTSEFKLEKDSQSTSFTTSIFAKDLSFSYGEKEILSKLNFEILKGDIFLIRGESGAGKSTILSLVLKVNSPSSGELKVDGKDINDLSNEILNNVGYVGPEPYLIQGTVRDNLLFGNTHLRSFSDAELWQALNLAQIESEVQSLPNKLDEVLNEFTQLSTGQKQRLSLARAFLRKPRLLVLDEATANVDHVNEEKFINRLVEVSKEMMVLVVSHKDSFDRVATKKLYLDKK